MTKTSWLALGAGALGIPLAVLVDHLVEGLRPVDVDAAARPAGGHLFRLLVLLPLLALLCADTVLHFGVHWTLPFILVFVGGSRS